MPDPNSDQLALIAQADLDRLVRRVLHPVLVDLQPMEVVGAGAVGPVDENTFFESARAVTHNALCQEARKAFALTVGAVFERHIRVWLSHAAPLRTNEIQTARGLSELIRLTKEVKLVDVTALPFVPDLEELWEVVNALRHGEGRATNKLAAIAPSLFPDPVFPPDNRFTPVVISDADFERYYCATMNFWGAVGASPFP
jgi:hypothetical protein